MPGRVTLRVTAGPIAGRVFALEGHDTFVFGRSPDCHAGLSPDDTTASRHHFLLEVNPPAARLRDLGSLNGTYVNGLRCGGRGAQETPEEGARHPWPEVDLKDGDRIRVGATAFDVWIEEPAFCCGCGRTIAEGERPSCAWLAGTFLCLACKARAGEPSAAPPGPAQPRGDMEDLLRRDDPFEALKWGAEMPRHVPGYETERLLGKGGAGAVYLARRKADGRRFAIKVMLAQVAVDEVAREAFLREIEVTRSLRHPNIVELLDHGSAGSCFYFVMEYCAGGSISGLISKRGGPLALEACARIALAALDGLAQAHRKGFVHRDLKPDNLLLADERALVAKVADFGLAKSFEQAGLSGLTATGAAAGTLLFMPREQLTGFRLVKPTSDVWSFGATLYYMLTRRYPRDFPPGVDPLQVVLRGGVVPIRARDPRLPEGLALVMDRALADDPAHRYETAAEFREALGKAF